VGLRASLDILAERKAPAVAGIVTSWGEGVGRSGATSNCEFPFCAVLPRFPKGRCFLKVRRLCPFVHDCGSLVE
jgi:hypothetical protein